MPSLSVNPETVHTAQPYTFTGEGFTPDEELKLQFAEPGCCRTLKAWVHSTGEFMGGAWSTSVPGTYRITATRRAKNGDWAKKPAATVEFIVT